MKGMTIAHAAEVCGGTIYGQFSPKTELGRAVIDSRAVEAGDFFVAYKGANTDGHRFISMALDRGAVCALAEYVPEGENRAVLVVKNVQEALERICAEYRRSLSIPVVGITGSVGKTSAKEMISAVLAQRYSVLKTEKNLNNQIGVPMTVSRLTPEHEAAVIEMGISDFGEMSVLAKIAQPTVAVFTVIGHAHLEFLHDLAGVMKAKTEMLDEMDDDALVICNGDDAMLRTLRTKKRKLSFGLSRDCDVRAEHIRFTAAGAECEIVYEHTRIPVKIPAFGQHMVYAALEGAAVGIAMGLTPEEIIRGVAAFETIGRRAAVTETESLTIVDDSYNANPDSCCCGIDSLVKLPGRHVCVFGDMLELGEESARMHEGLGLYAKEQGVELVVCCGELSRYTAQGAGEVGIWYPSREALLEALPLLLKKGDRVLVKASRASKMEEAAELLKGLVL